MIKYKQSVRKIVLVKYLRLLHDGNTFYKKTPVARTGAVVSMKLVNCVETVSVRLLDKLSIKMCLKVHVKINVTSRDFKKKPEKESTSSRRLRSHESSFQFSVHCLFCS